MAVWSEVRVSQLDGAKRLDAEYYQPDYLRYAEVVAPGDRIGNVVKEVMHPIEIRRVYADEGIQILLAQNIRRNELDFCTTVFMPKSVESKLAKNRLRYGDVVLTRSGANYGDCAPYLGKPESIYACADCLVLRPNQNIDGRYLSTYLNSRIGRGLIKRGQYGAAQPHVAPTHIREMRVPRAGAIENEICERVSKGQESRLQSIAMYAQAEQLLLSELGLAELDLRPTLFYERGFSEMRQASRFDSEYWMPIKWEILGMLQALPGRPVSSMFKTVRSLLSPEREPPGALFRNYDLPDALTAFLDDSLPPSEVQDIGSTKKRFRPGNVVISRLRSYLKEIALVCPAKGPGQIGSSEFIVLRKTEKKVLPEALVVFLRCPWVQTILKWCQDGSNHPRFNEREILSLPLPDAILDCQEEIARLVQGCRAARTESRRLLDEAKKMVEQAILGQ